MAMGAPAGDLPRQDRLKQSMRVSHLGSDISADCLTRPQYVERSYWEAGRSRLPGKEADMARLEARWLFHQSRGPLRIHAHRSRAGKICRIKSANRCESQVTMLKLQGTISGLGF